MAGRFTRRRLVGAGAAGLVALVLGGANEFWRSGADAGRRWERRVVRPFTAEAIATPISVTLRGAVAVSTTWAPAPPPGPYTSTSGTVTSFQLESGFFYSAGGGGGEHTIRPSG